MPRLYLALVAGFLGMLALLNGIFIVDQTEQAVVLQFGKIERVESTPGLKWKTPFLENVQFFDKRLLDFNAAPTEVTTEDKKLGITERVVVDAYVQYRIKDPVQFLKAVGSEDGLQSRLSSVLEASIRSTMGRVSLRELLSGERTEIMHRVRDEVNRKASQQVVVTGADAAKAAAVGTPLAPAAINPLAATGRGFGIEVVDVRIMRADLPKQISQSTFNRMQASFAKEAQRFRSEGDEQSITIKSTAERERTELLATARRQAEITRGEGDGEAGRIYASAFTKDPSFFEFYRSMQAYRAALAKEDTTVVMSPGEGFLSHLEKP